MELRPARARSGELQPGLRDVNNDLVVVFEQVKVNALIARQRLYRLHNQPRAIRL